MAYKVQRSPAVEQDIEIILDHLFRSYVSLGEPVQDAFDRAVRRVGVLRSDLDTLGSTPHQGTAHDDIRAGLRHVTKKRAVFYFQVDEAAQVVRVVAVFFSGQDHRRHVLKRL